MTSRKKADTIVGGPTSGEEWHDLHCGPMVCGHPRHLAVYCALKFRYSRPGSTLPGIGGMEPLPRTILDYETACRDRGHYKDAAHDVNDCMDNAVRTALLALLDRILMQPPVAEPLHGEVSA
jgi:hypothetical protein